MLPAPAAAATFSPPVGSYPGRGVAATSTRGLGARWQLCAAKPASGSGGVTNWHDFAFALLQRSRVAPPGVAVVPSVVPCVTRAAVSPQPLLALVRAELIEGLGVLLAQEGLVIVLEALVVLGRPLAQLRVGPHHALLAHRGLGP